jgi:acetylornithine/N-succinyldiaminopimelate aminotransferase
MDIRQTDAQYIAHTYARAPLLAERGSGALVWDESGREYIDLGSGIGVNAFGAADPVWAEAVSAQAHTLQHLSNLYYTAPQVRLARLLCEKTGMRKVFFGNSGAEANECVIKCARKYSSDKYGPGRATVVTLTQSFHGRTLATLTATGQDAMHVHFGPFPEGFRYTPANDFAAMEQALAPGDVCCVLVELVQGEGGVIALDEDFVKKTAALCAEKDVLFAVDEVQTGNGRTGALYAWMRYGVKPDLFSTAKGLGGGLPLGACVMGEKCADVLQPGTHGSTFGGNPVCCAGALTVLERMDEAFLASVRAKGERIRKALEGAPGVLGLSGLGLMVGVTTVKPAKEVVAAALEKGVIALTAHEKLRLLPPLCITEAQLDKALEILKGVLAP